jgi:hypothetical protein
VAKGQDLASSAGRLDELDADQEVCGEGRELPSPSELPNLARMVPMKEHRIYTTPFASVYPMYVAKAERKGRTKAEVDEILRWLTGYSQTQLEAQITASVDFRKFFADAPAMNPHRSLIKGLVCGVRVEEVEEPLMREIRYLDKLVDELAKGKAMEKIFRQA